MLARLRGRPMLSTIGVVQIGPDVCRGRQPRVMYRTGFIVDVAYVAKH